MSKRPLDSDHEIVAVQRLVELVSVGVELMLTFEGPSDTHGVEPPTCRSRWSQSGISAGGSDAVLAVAPDAPARPIDHIRSQSDACDAQLLQTPC